MSETTERKSQKQLQDRKGFYDYEIFSKKLREALPNAFNDGVLQVREHLVVTLEAIAASKDFGTNF